MKRPYKVLNLVVKQGQTYQWGRVGCVSQISFSLLSESLFYLVKQYDNFGNKALNKMEISHVHIKDLICLLLSRIGVSLHSESGFS